jgi:hypothetical protein
MISDFDNLRIAVFGNYFGAPGIRVSIRSAEDDTPGLAVRRIFELGFFRIGGDEFQKRCL